jgi:hypothetical protein
MASTYSDLKFELITTGEQSGTWGVTTDTNIGTAIQEAITGSADVAYTSAADVTVTLTDTNATQTARNLRLNITESGAGIGYVGNLILGSGCQIEKFYVVNNGTTAVKTIKNTTGTGVAIPANSSVLVFNNGTNVVQAVTAFGGTGAVLIPVGTTGDRPGTPATGMLRYNSTISQCEIWNGAAWVAVGGSSYTVITNEQFNGDGSTVAFTLGSSQTTDSCIVTINGVVQIPTTAYSVSGTYPTCVLTFTEAPAISDIIDVREITTTTSVTAISNSPGNAIVAVSATIGQVNTTGNLVAQINATAPSLTANSTMSFQLVSDTSLKILVRGADGVTRSTTLTLA